MRALCGLRAVGDDVTELARYLAASPCSRIRQWHALRDLDDHLLADIGLSRSDVQPGPPRFAPQAQMRSVERETKWQK